MLSSEQPLTLFLITLFLGTPHVTYADDDRCPQWGDLEGFQQQGLKRGRVMLFTDTLRLSLLNR